MAESKSRLSKVVGADAFTKKAISGMSVGILKGSQIDMHAFLKKACNKNGASSSKKEGSSVSKDFLGQKSNNLLLMKIPGPSAAGKQSVPPFFGPKVSSPKSNLNVFIPSNKDLSKLKAGKSPRAKGDSTKKQLPAATPQLPSAGRQMQSNLVKMLFGKNQLSKILKPVQPNANGTALAAKVEKKNKNGSSSQLKEGNKAERDLAFTARSKKPLK